MLIVSQSTKFQQNKPKTTNYVKFYIKYLLNLNLLNRNVSDSQYKTVNFQYFKSTLFKFYQIK